MGNIEEVSFKLGQIDGKLDTQAQDRAKMKSDVEALVGGMEKLTERVAVLERLSEWISRFKSEGKKILIISFIILTFSNALSQKAVEVLLSVIGKALATILGG